MFGLYFSFDSFKYIDFNLKINFPLLLSEQTTVLGKVFELSRKSFFPIQVWFDHKPFTLVITSQDGLI